MAIGPVAGGGGAAVSGHCTWTKTGGVWKVTSSCAAGYVCMAMNTTSPAQPATDGTAVTFTNAGTINGNYGMTDAAFNEFLTHRGIPIASVLTTRIGDTDTIADTVNGDQYEIPCVAATTATPVVTTPPPRFGP